ncbi:MAG TPA: cytochrome c family protein [Rhizomicrobium sp.]|nr:cytochrome c family protein [Rhizomicrobium sp.]
MDSFEWNKIIGAVLGTAIFIFVVRQAAEVIYEPEKPAKPGYVVEGVVESTSGAATAPVAETIPDWGTVLPAADVAAGKTISGRCEQCRDLSKGGPNKIGPNLYDVVDRDRATHPGFDYSSAMKAKGGKWTYDELFKYLKSPQSYVPGTKMSFAGLPREQERINLIAYLRSDADSPAAIPAPAPKAAAAAPAAADAAKPAAGADAAKPVAGTAAGTAPGTAEKGNTAMTAKPATPAASAVAPEKK